MCSVRLRHYIRSRRFISSLFLRTIQASEPWKARLLLLRGYALRQFSAPSFFSTTFSVIICLACEVYPPVLLRRTTIRENGQGPWVIDSQLQVEGSAKLHVGIRRCGLSDQSDPSCAICTPRLHRTTPASGSARIRTALPCGSATLKYECPQWDGGASRLSGPHSTSFIPMGNLTHTF